MGFLSASSGFTRFRVTDPVPDELWRQIPELLKKRGLAFTEIEDTADERGFGWVCFDDMLDSFWRTAPPEKGAYMAFTLRLDTRRVAPAVMKKHLQIALGEEEKRALEQGRKHIGRDRKKEVKEQVRLRLLARTLPVPAVFDVMWNMQTNIILLCTTSAKVAELFVQHFTDTFDLHLEPLTPYGLALNILGEKAQDKLDAVEPTVFSLK